ncbi:MAG: hypothetical protein GKR94_28715 [Gammaproteobacteria bacterium]|nr:hypothetical protein [Gammaproteobacteria bacterium]
MTMQTWNETDGLLNDVDPSLFEEAVQLARHARNRLSDVKQKVLRLLSLLVLGTVGSVIATAVIAFASLESEPAHLLAAFILGGFLLTSLATLLALLTVLWRAFVYEYISRLDASNEAQEATTQAYEFARAVSEIGSDPKYERDVTELIVRCFIRRLGESEVREELASLGLICQVQEHDAEVRQRIAQYATTQITSRDRFADELQDVASAHFARYPELDMPLDLFRPKRSSAEDDQQEHAA